MIKTYSDGVHSQKTIPHDHCERVPYPGDRQISASTLWKYFQRPTVVTSLPRYLYAIFASSFGYAKLEKILLMVILQVYPSSAKSPD